MRLGPYEVIAPLGAGGMGEVYRARDTRLGREVAIKVLPAQYSADPERLHRFELEARAVAALTHPNVLVVHDVGEAEGTPYMVTELLAGESLRERLRAGRPALQEALAIAVEIGEGLAAAHEQGIVHRDLKPENVFLTRDGHPKILDFGLAKLVEPRGADPATVSTATGGTARGTVLGTLPYMAPEQARGQAVDRRTDVFALGCVLYELFAGQQAFPGESAADVAAAILTRSPRLLTELASGLPEGVETVVRRCLEKRPEARFASAGEVAEALRAVARGAFAAAPAKAGPPPPCPSVAVLPFANLSADSQQEYFCDGMAEEVINVLAHVEGLRVVARTSAFAFKGRHEDVRRIGASLGVGAVLEGSVRRAGDRLRITAQLVDVASGFHLFSERWDRRLEDVFAIQDEIALAIVEKLQVALLAAEPASVLRRGNVNLDAHDAYLRGMFEWNTMTPEGLVRSQEHFRRAIAIDPTFAPPYAQLADSYGSVAWWADLPPASALAEALPLVRQALALEPNLAHAHSVLGHTRAFFLRDWAGGEAELRRAVELAPSSALPQVYLALLLASGQRGLDEAAARAGSALRLDPLSPPVNCWAGVILAFSGCERDGLDVLARQAAATPQMWMPHYFLATVQANVGLVEAARVGAELALELSGGSSVAMTLAAGLARLGGDPARCDELLASLEERALTRYVPPTFLARVHLVRGDSDAAVHHFRKALEANDPWLASHRLYSRLLPANPQVDALLAGELP